MRPTVCALLFLVALVAHASAKSCNEVAVETEGDPMDDDECPQTEHNAYIKCIRRRMKRSIDCDDADDGDDECNGCDCNYCSTNACESSCSNCCSRSTCNTHHCCYRTCSNQCRTSTCRKSCRRDCVQKISDKKETVHVADRPVIVESQSAPNHNITTVIHIQNAINNTNLIDVPITVNNSNVHNVTLDAGNILANIGGAPGYISSGGGAAATDHAQSQHQCCHLISPQQCMYIPQPPYRKCYHVRSKHCGKVCRASTVHVQKHEICEYANEAERQPSCREEVVYIPQPRPRCYYQQRWPFVACGMLEAECGGCYAHHSTKTEYTGGCPYACFDDGYNVGPMYRQGPYYRPGYAPVPSCYQTGACGGGAASMDAGGGYALLPEGYPGAPYPGGYPSPPGYASPGFYPYAAGSYPAESYAGAMQGGEIVGGYPSPPEAERAYSVDETAHKINQRSTERNVADDRDGDNLPPKLISIEAKIEPPNRSD